jgi:hypothetical protein
MLHHLDEYRTDENKESLLAGLFGGATVGILADWFTSENFVVTRPSLVLIALFAVLACYFWIRMKAIDDRATKARDKMLGTTGRTAQTGIEDA